ncbi:type I glutamate--ammonia ligase [Rhodococcus wratislaviensis]|uniref:glutamine synthetase n=1 Tax=Rhodococcus wratislaviensis TaxID=44752 RepID=UPI003651D863
METTNHDGVLMGKVLSPAKYRAGRAKGFAIPDLALGLDLGNDPALGFEFPSWRATGLMPDIEYRPDENTLVQWKPGLASVICDYWTPEGEPVASDPRQALKKIESEYAKRGLSVLTCIEIEATVFEESMEEARARNYRDLTPLGGGAGAALVHAKSPAFVQYMDGVVDRFNQLDIAWEGWADEAAAGQIEFNFVPTDALTAADTWVRARQIMREVAMSQGHSVTFMAKSSAEYGQGSHLNVSVHDEAGNIFYDAADPAAPSARMSHFLGGVMDTLAAATSFALPTVTSFRRLVDFDGPPTTLTWGISNKSCSVRAVLAGAKATRLEYRLPAADSNMYCTLAVFLAAGLAGLDESATPPPEFDRMAWMLPPGTAPAVPNNLYDAIEALENDTQLRKYLGDEFIDYWIGLRRWEWLSFHTKTERDDDQISVWESVRYFELV